MNWLNNRIYRKDKGFTLVELMVVIIILAVLTGIAIPSYLALRNRARVQATRSEMQNIATAISVYEADHEAWPAALANLQDDDLEGTGPYMANVPTADAWGNGYGYATDAPAAGDYTLSSGGPDGAIDGVDDIVLVNGVLAGE